jgi:hypothetical protein
VSYPEAMRNFLVIYNRRTGQNSVREFPPGQGRAAIRARFEEERQNQGNPDIEVVVLGSKSRDELMRTHSRYFQSAQDLLRPASV